MNKWSRIIAVAALAVAVGAVLLLKNNDRDGTSEFQPQSTEEESLPRLIDLGADKCIPCKMMAPILEELKEEYRGRLRVTFIDVWKNPTAGQPFGIRVIPTQIFISPSGEELYRHEGFMSREDILKKWKELGIELDEG